jgi:hypothetical protein
MIPCATCGADPVGEFNDGSPRYDPRTCLHAPIRPDDPLHPKYLAAIRAGKADKVVVELTPDEIAEATECARLRQSKSKRKKLDDKLGHRDLVSDVTGALGERAFAKWIGTPWDCTTGRYGGSSDVRGVQVRTVTKTSYRLIVHESDRGSTPVVLVVDHAPRFWIRGFLLARDAKHREYLDDPNRERPSYFVPPDLLRPMQEFLHEPKVRAAMNIAPEGA